MLFSAQRIVYDALLSLNCFFFKEKFVFYIHALASRFQDVYRLKCSEDLVKKNYISAYIGHKPFIQTGKYSSFNQRIIYQSYYGALLALNYFFFKEMCYSHALASRLRDVY